MTERTFSPASPKYPDTKKTIDTVPGGSKVVVAGAGVFGSWIALMLQESGYEVTLVDPWGAGHSRSSSGGETRLVRAFYGDNQLYFDWTLRSIELLEKYQQYFDQKVYHQIGTLWFSHQQNDPLVDAAIRMSNQRKLEVRKMSVEEGKKAYPHVYLDDLEYLLLEKHSGYVLARESVKATVNYFQKIGGKYITGKVNFENLSKESASIKLNRGETLPYDFLIAACGPWLGHSFPELLSEKVTVTKQDVLFFGLPDSHAEFFTNQLPSWVDQSTGEFFYGLPQGTGRGFKVALDRRGKEFDPENSDRLPDKGIIDECREFIAHRFPSLGNAPLVESLVCQYTNTNDGNFICDLHPENKNILIVGGGSGHGFKHGPVMGEYVKNLIRGIEHLKPVFALEYK